MRNRSTTIYANDETEYLLVRQLNNNKLLEESLKKNKNENLNKQKSKLSMSFQLYEEQEITEDNDYEFAKPNQEDEKDDFDMLSYKCDYNVFFFNFPVRENFPDHKGS